MSGVRYKKQEHDDNLICMSADKGQGGIYVTSLLLRTKVFLLRSIAKIISERGLKIRSRSAMTDFFIIIGTR